MHGIILTTQPDPCCCALCHPGKRHLLCDLYGHYETMARKDAIERIGIEVINWNLARSGKWTRPK
jgi:hypothetical protein